MNLNRFIDTYGECSFDEVPFTEVDNVIFASLSYLNLYDIFFTNRFRKGTILEVANLLFQSYSSKNRTIYAERKAIKLLQNIKNTKRYKDLLLYHYIHEEGEDEQFSAFTIEIQPNLVYVSFEGTDQLVSGWKEDFMFSYMFPTLSQRRAISYVNNHFFLCHKKIILGGHSKGGNLALVAGMYANFWVKRKIIKIYNNDGPGLLLEQIESRQYSSIENRLIHIIPNYSIVGLLLLHGDNTVVVRSMKKGILAHDVMSWVVDDKKFQRTSLSSYSFLLKNQLTSWLNQYDMEERRLFVISLFDVFKRAGIKSTVDLLKHKKLILRFLLESKDIDAKTKKMIREFINVFLQVFKDVKVEEIKFLFLKEGKE